MQTEDRQPWDHAHQAVQCKVADIVTVSVKDDTPEARQHYDEFVAGADKYLSVFAKPIEWDQAGSSGKEVACLHCGEPLTGLMNSLLGRGGFEWGLAHGEGHCRGCGWPARAYHFAKYENGDEVFTIRGLILQYLPDFDAEAKARDEAKQAA